MTPPSATTPPGAAVAAPVLVTGACGLVGSAVVTALLRRGYRVAATDLESDANTDRSAALAATATSSAGSLTVHWADLTDDEALTDLVSAVSPQAIIHLAAVIPPTCYRRPDAARAVNVGATTALVRAATAMAHPPRFIQASSIAVYGSRNPHRFGERVLTPDTPVNPRDLYGAHKAECEVAVRDSGLDWVILRLGGVLSTSMRNSDPAMIAFEAILPGDGRLQTVAVDDVATAFANAMITPYSRRVFLIGGDDTHRVGQAEVSRRIAGAMGMPFAIPAGRPGNPDDDDAWFATDWMDSSEAQRVLAFQHTSFPELLAETSRRLGIARHATLVAVPVLWLYLTTRSPYRGRPGRFADPWSMVAELFGKPEPDGSYRADEQGVHGG